MITYSVIMNDHGDISEIEVKGHANHSPYGTDVVCASVSIAVLVTSNIIKILEMDKDAIITISDGYGKITMLENNQQVSKILYNLKYTLDQLKMQYPENIEMKGEK